MHTLLESRSTIKSSELISIVAMVVRNDGSFFSKENVCLHAVWECRNNQCQLVSNSSCLWLFTSEVRRFCSNVLRLVIKKLNVSDSIKIFPNFEKTKSSKRAHAPFFVALVFRCKTYVFRRKEKLHID